MLATPDIDSEIGTCLTRVQHQLFDLGGELCMPGHTAITADAVTSVEQALDGFNADLPPLKDFVLPGGTVAAATCHVARTVCRRAERRVLTLSREETVNEHAQIYLNRLSDLLFVLSRALNRRAGQPEPLWQKGL